MPKQLKLKAGSKVHPSACLYEGYEADDSGFTANVGIDKIEDIMQHFIVLHDEPLFFILELPCTADQETPIRPGVVETMHKDVYYIDGCSREEAITILLRVGDILYNDGISSFGFGGHESGDEIMFGKYNVLTIFTNAPDDYPAFFKAHEIPLANGLVTAWDTFTASTPGESTRYEVKGKSVFDIPEQFRDWGIYLAERREE